jgi:hypothetical protein
MRLHPAQPEDHTTVDLLDDLDRCADHDDNEDRDDYQEKERQFSHEANLSAS